MVGTLLMAAALAAPAPKLVMPEWTKVAVSAELVSFYADHLAQALRTHHLEVITSQEMGALLGLERQRELLGCSETSSSCMAELGSALGCEAVLLVSLAKLDDTLRVNLKVVSSKDGNIKVETTGEADSQKQLLEVLEQAAARLAAGLEDRPTPPPVAAEVTRGGVVRRRAWIPAAFGAAFTVVGIVSAVMAGNKWAQLNALSTPAPYETAADIAAAGNAWKLSTWVSFALASACFVTSGLMYLLGGEQAVAPTVMISPTGASLGLVGAWP